MSGEDGLPKDRTPERIDRRGMPNLGKGKKDPFIQDVIRQSFHGTVFLNIINMLLLCYLIVKVG